MVVTTTPNKFLNQITVGTENGTWGPYINANEGILDNSFGGSTTIPLTNANVTLSQAQYQCVFLVFTGALSGNIIINFPQNVGSFYTVQNLTSNTSAFNVTFTTGLGEHICCPWGEAVDIMSDGTNVKFRNLGRVGSYMDVVTFPAWVSNCTVPPYLNCDGTTFSSATYPVLYTMLGGNTLPDTRGRTRYALNQGTGRLTAVGGGIDGNTLGSGGGLETTTLAQVNMPSYALPVTDPGHFHNFNGLAAGAGLAAGVDLQTVALPTTTNVTGITVNSGGSNTPFSNVGPGYAGGYTLVRAG